MRTKLTAAAAIVVAVAASGASATVPTSYVDCRIANFAEQTTTGSNDTFVGVAVGYVVAADPTVTASIRCFVRINGEGGYEYDVRSTPRATGTGTAATTGQITYDAYDDDIVELCAEFTVDSSGPQLECWATLLLWLPDPFGLGVLCGAVLGPDKCHALGFKVDPR